MKLASGDLLEKSEDLHVEFISSENMAKYVNTLIQTAHELALTPAQFHASLLVAVKYMEETFGLKPMGIIAVPDDNLMN